MRAYLRFLLDPDPFGWRLQVLNGPYVPCGDLQTLLMQVIALVAAQATREAQAKIHQALGLNELIESIIDQRA